MWGMECQSVRKDVITENKILIVIQQENMQKIDSSGIVNSVT